MKVQSIIFFVVNQKMRVYSSVPINWPGRITDPLGLRPKKYLATQQFKRPDGKFSNIVISDPVQIIWLDGNFSQI